MILPPALVGLFAVMAVPTVYVTGVVYVRLVGATAFTVMLTVAESMPASLLAVTV